jgi:pimeloyl-ACP methyl ester carboxylesterase
VHGLSDSSTSFEPLQASLQKAEGWRSVNGNEPSRVVDASFNFPACNTIERGAAELASHVGRFPLRSGDRLSFIAHSMGGLIVRRMLADNLLRVGNPVVGLVTLGTPHLGYPYIAFDDTIKCASQVQQMKSVLIDGNPLLEGGTLSPFLRDLYRRWNPAQAGYRWFAAGGAFCDNWLRLDPFAGFEGWTPEINGCRRTSGLSDGVVCLDSAITEYPQAQPALLRPTMVFNDPGRLYKHAPFLGWGAVSVLCGGQPTTFFSVTNPPPPADGIPDAASGLFRQIVDFLYAL